MLDYLVLNNKKSITLEDSSGEKVNCIDLLTPVAVMNDVPPQEYIIVNEYYVARPDLISLAVYGNDRYADVICKYNGISNPFEINENDVIMIPSLNNVQLMFSAAGKTSELITKESEDSFISKEFPFQKNKSEKRTAANSVVGEKNYVIDKSLGVVFY